MLCSFEMYRCVSDMKRRFFEKMLRGEASVVWEMEGLLVFTRHAHKEVGIPK
jgi:hypothetical protein